MARRAPGAGFKQERLRARGMPAPSGALEKRELVKLILESSSETTCVICCDDFEQNDVLRCPALRTGHVTHPRHILRPRLDA